MKRRVIHDEHPELLKTLEQLKQQKGFTFTPAQCGAINYGLCIQVDVLENAHPDYNSAHLSEIFTTQHEGLDPTPLLDFELTADKAREIRLGLQAGLDVSVFADPKMPLVNMQWIRRAMAKGIDVRAYPEFSGSITKIIKKYNELCGIHSSAKAKRSTIRIVKIQEEVNEMVVEYDKLEELRQAIETINDLKLDKVQRVKDKLYEMNVVTPKRKILTPLEKETYFEVIVG